MFVQSESRNQIRNNHNMGHEYKELFKYIQISELLQGFSNFVKRKEGKQKIKSWRNSFAVPLLLVLISALCVPSTDAHILTTFRLSRIERKQDQLYDESFETTEVSSDKFLSKIEINREKIGLQRKLHQVCQYLDRLQYQSDNYLRNT